jgi:ankyrin repeat protein
MRHAMLVVGLGFAALVSSACGSGPVLPLAVAAGRNAAATVQQLLREGQAANRRDPHGVTALMWAARTGAVDAIGALLDGGADLEVRDERNGWTALVHAVHTRHLDAVRILLERGADANAQAGLTTPLMMAAADPDPRYVRLLLAHGADAAKRGAGGSTALSEAVSGGALSDIDRPLFGGCHPDTVRALTTHDPALDLPDSIAGRDALWWARFHGCREVIDLVQPGGARVASAPKE